jgi:hypothetical protein
MLYAVTRRAGARLGALAVMLSILAILSIQPATAGEEVTIDGVPHVKNGATPSGGMQTLKLEEAWRIGGDDEDGLLLALVSEVCGDEHGNVYVLDAQLCQVHVFSPTGELLRTVFAQGEGPGETLRPRDLVITDKGVGVAEEFPAKVIMVDRNGLPIDDLKPMVKGAGDGNLGALTSAGFGGGQYILAGTEIKQDNTRAVQDRVYFLSSFSETGEELARYCESTSQYNFQKFAFSEREHIPSFWWAYDVANDGTVYSACNRDEYAISVFSPDGKLIRVIEREFKPTKRTAAEKKRFHDMIEASLKGFPFEYTLEVEDYEPVIDYFHRGIRLDGDGNLWVTSSRGIRDHTGGAAMVYDVFDPDGHFTRQVAIECEANMQFDGLFWVSDDQVVLVTGAMSALAAQFGEGASLESEDEDGSPQEIICFNVKIDA